MFLPQTITVYSELSSLLWQLIDKYKFKTFQKEKGNYSIFFLLNYTIINSQQKLFLIFTELFFVRLQDNICLYF